MEEQITQDALAKKAGISPAYVNKLIKNSEKIVNKTFIQILEELGYDIEKGLIELQLKADIANNKEKKKLKSEIKSVEDTVKAVKIAMKSMNKFISSYETSMEISE